MPLRKISACGPDPRLGLDPRLAENDNISSVRFSSRTLSDPMIGGLKTVGVAALSGRKMVLKPLPVQLPVKAESGPRMGGGTGAAAGAPRICGPANGLRTWWILKFARVESALESVSSSAMELFPCW